MTMVVIMVTPTPAMMMLGSQFLGRGVDARIRFRNQLDIDFRPAFQGRLDIKGIFFFQND